MPTLVVPPDAAFRQQALLDAIGLQNQGRADEAGALFRRVLADDPDNAIALYSLAALLMKQPVGDEATRLVEHGVRVAPQFAPLHFAHAMVMQSLGKKEAALASYDRAVQLKPDYTEALINSGALLRELHRHHDALLRFNRVLEIDPDHESALGNCGILLTEFKRSDKAIAMFERLLRRNPDYPYALGLLCYERLHACDWTGFEALAAEIVAGVRAGKRTCKTLGLMAISGTASDHFLAARVFAEQWFPKGLPPLWRGERYGHRRLRIAYVSPDLREHPVGHLTAGVFERHDRARFETFAISLGVDDGSRLRQRIVAAFDYFHDVRGQGSRQIAELMRSLEIDVAIDLAGYTSDARLDIFAHRPAPVQATWLGYPGTLGSQHFDWILADRHVIPDAHRPFYSEQVAWLPDTYLPTDGGLQLAERTPTRAECGLPETGAVLCSFSHDYKIHPDVFAVWMRILRRTPGAVLWLMCRNDFTQANLRRAAEVRGVDPARIVFAGRVPRVEDHLARYRLADIFLDTSPYNAHTTAADALMAGLPVVTVLGDAFPARVAASVLHAAGLPELVAPSLAAYEALVLELLADRPRLDALKAKVAGARTTAPLFDTERFTRRLEEVLVRLAAEVGAAAATSPAVGQAATAAAALATSDASAATTMATTATTAASTTSADPALAAELAAVAAPLAAADWPQAELHLRRYLRGGGRDPAAAAGLAAVARGYGLPDGFELVEPPPRPAGAGPRWLLVKAWGYGFWSDVHHVLGQLLVAELTGRTPVVHWGRNSLFRSSDDGDEDAFGHFFEPVSTATLATVRAAAAAGSVYPPKWRGVPLEAEDVAKWHGADSRLAAAHGFLRDEAVVVSDFYATVHSLLPWIGHASRWHGLGEDAIYAELFARHLKPRPAILARVDAFARERLAGRAWVAVHMRGTDKVAEAPQLARTQARCVEFVDRIVEINPGIGVFLLTDSAAIQRDFERRYGDRLAVTPARRSASQVGVHLQGHPGRAVGEEVLVDALLAARCAYFVGNRESNVSLAIASLKRWPDGFLALLGEKSCRSENLFIHRRDAAAARPVAAAPV